MSKTSVAAKRVNSWHNRRVLHQRRSVLSSIVSSRGVC